MVFLLVPQSLVGVAVQPDLPHLEVMRELLRRTHSLGVTAHANRLADVGLRHAWISGTWCQSGIGSSPFDRRYGRIGAIGILNATLVSSCVRRE